MTRRPGSFDPLRDRDRCRSRKDGTVALHAARRREGPSPSTRPASMRRRWTAGVIGKSGSERRKMRGLSNMVELLRGAVAPCSQVDGAGDVQSGAGVCDPKEDRLVICDDDAIDHMAIVTTFLHDDHFSYRRLVSKLSLQSSICNDGFLHTYARSFLWQSTFTHL